MSSNEVVSELAAALNRESTSSQALADAWSHWEATLGEMRTLLESTARFRTARHRAKAYHALMEMQALAYNLTIAPRMSNPRLFTNLTWQTDIYASGIVAPDFHYALTVLDGRQSYRLSGRLGATKTFIIQTWNGMLGEKGVMIDGAFDLASMQVDGGRFEIILGGEQRADNWLALDSSCDHQLMIIRRQLDDMRDDPGELYIDRIGPITSDWYDADEFDEDAMAVRIRRAADFARFVGTVYNIGLYESYLFEGKPNRIGVRPAAVGLKTGASPLATYAGGVFKLAPGEMLLIDLPTVEGAAYWSFQLADVWSRSLPFHERQTSLNRAQVAVDDDGHVRLVIAAEDPGVANWLDSAGWQEGIVIFRNFGATPALAMPDTRVIMGDELDRYLPAATRRVTPAQRNASLSARRAGFLKLLGE